LVYAFVLSWKVKKQAKGTEKMQEISDAVRSGSMAYLWKQYKVIALFAVIIAIVLFLTINWQMSVTFIVGAFLSALAGYVGMNIATQANVRTAEAAKGGMAKAMSVAFQGGAVSGMTVVALGLVGVTGFYWAFQDPTLLIGFGFGASLISLFARVGGGIFTKAADVGADLVGKVEAGIPEDDPRNPAVIADNVGDNVGDCAGMGADLFETYAVTLIAAMLLGIGMSANGMATGITYPLALGAVAIVASIIGTLFVKLGKKKNIMGALYRGTFITAGLSAVAFYFITQWFNLDIKLFYATLVGLVITVLLTLITDYYTSKDYKPVKEIAEASQTGPGTNIITGLAVGLQSTFWPVLVIVCGILTAYWLGGVYGIAISAVAMLATTGMVVAIDSYGPITDNAGGIAEMAKLPEDVRQTTDALDAVGNTTKAVTKGYAIGSAALAALALFAAYREEIMLAVQKYNLESILDLSIDNPLVLVGLFIGGVLPFVFGAYTMKAVGKAAFKVVENVRHQFKTKKIMEGTDKPDYAECVRIVTGAAQKEMIFPAVLAVAAPLAVGFILGPLALGGLLAGVIVVGLLLAIQMTTGGASWDNAKKYIEDGEYGGKGSTAHKAAVVGDTVGDPFKDTTGPALNSLIKVMNTIALIFAFMIAQYTIINPDVFAAGEAAAVGDAPVEYQSEQFDYSFALTGIAIQELDKCVVIESVIGEEGLVEVCVQSKDQALFPKDSEAITVAGRDGKEHPDFPAGRKLYVNYNEDGSERLVITFSEGDEKAKSLDLDTLLKSLKF
ncbi:sodium-translocating pyrophosphatase, partial [Patescibacteria group bacterium]